MDYFIHIALMALGGIIGFYIVYVVVVFLYLRIRQKLFEMWQDQLLGAMGDPKKQNKWWVWIFE